VVGKVERTARRLVKIAQEKNILKTESREAARIEALRIGEMGRAKSARRGEKISHSGGRGRSKGVRKN